MQNELERYCCTLLGLEECHIAPVPLVDRDYWIKFSQSKNTWTLYCYLFFVASAIAPRSRSRLASRSNVGIIPIDEDTHGGISIVENTLELLREEDIRKQLEASAINVG
jgi:hypothetical protein